MLPLDDKTSHAPLGRSSACKRCVDQLYFWIATWIQSVTERDVQGRDEIQNQAAIRRGDTRWIVFITVTVSGYIRIWDFLLEQFPTNLLLSVIYCFQMEFIAFKLYFILVTHSMLVVVRPKWIQYSLSVSN